MEIPHKSLKNGFSMPLFGIGTSQMGVGLGANPESDERDVSAMRAAIDLGITHFDTAEVYSDGYAETLLGRAIEGSDRSKLFLMSKVLPAEKSYDDYIEACRSSLSRVGTDYFDVYLLHRVPHDMETAMRAMNTLMDERLIRAIGISNFGVESSEKARALTKHPIVYNQVHYNLQFREPERAGLLEYCQNNDMFLAAWKPIGRGTLLANIPDILADMATKYEKTPAQIAINWLISQENVVTLVKTSNTEHLKENLGALDWKMDAADIEVLRMGYPNQQDLSDTVQLDGE